MTTKRGYAVFTADSDQDQVFCDLVLATSKKKALQMIADIRGTTGYLTTQSDSPAAYSANDLARLLGMVVMLTQKDSDENIKELRNDYAIDELEAEVLPVNAGEKEEVLPESITDEGEIAVATPKKRRR